ncbi:MAG TPA: B12-binding domain-containing radical SAM protein [Nitrospirae bacterium]|nr:radical SAM superfamily protein [bacterium BMS3Abin06]HDH13107.1 B12-binding domain-containing radical SAM protein [Nitrospirota bacterium]HDZ00360.1 B12-binding domain-containing radical SAM protein [Nitrospirota bacterium]
MKNIYFIEAKSPGSHIFSRTALPRLGSILLATILKNRGYNAKVFIEDISPPDWKQLEDADMICISSISSTATRAFQIAEKFRKLGISVAIGGPHSTFLPEESLEYADYVIRGEGEETLVELLENLESGKPLETIKGLSFKNSKQEIVHNPARELLKDLNEAPIPDFSIVHKWAEKAKVIPIATSRGCPFACKFCSVIPMFGRKYRFKSIDRIIEEIKAAAPQKAHVFFIDDNFAANKKRTKALLRALIDTKIKFEWSAQVRTDIAKDPELLKLMEAAGCFSVYIGFESINPKTLSLYNKGQGLEDIENAIRAVKKHSINIHGMFVLGSDTDDIKTIRNTEKFAKKLDIDSIQFMILTPLPGTPVFEDLKSAGRLIHTDWSKYDAHHAVFEPKLMTAFELHVETLKAMSKFYSWPAILRNLWQFDFFYAVVGLYGKRSVKKALSGARNYVDQLRDLITAEFDGKTDKLRQFFQQKQGKSKNIILNTTSLEKDESRFFSTFLSKLDKKLVVNKESFRVTKNTLAITPLVESLKSRHEKGRQQLSEFYEKYKDRLDSIKVINMESISLYKSCVNIGLLLNVNAGKIRKAYEQALKSIGGKGFECNLVLVMVEQ